MIELRAEGLRTRAFHSFALFLPFPLKTLRPCVLHPGLRIKFNDFVYSGVGGNFLRTYLNHMKTLFHLAFSLLLLLLVGCEKSENLDTSFDEEKIKENLKNWVKVSEQGDVDGYFNFITDNFCYIGTPETEPISDPDSLRSFLSTFFADNTFSFPKWETHEVLIRGDLAIHRYSGIAYIKPKNDTTVLELDRTYLDVLKKNEKGIWKAYLHSFELNE